MKERTINEYFKNIDHTILKPNATKADVEKICEAVAFVLNLFA